jgi:hypothetical protein
VQLCRVVFVIFCGLLCSSFKLGAAFPFATCAVAAQSPYQAQIQATTDGVNFSSPGSISNPVFAFPGPGGVGASTETVGCNLLYSKSNKKFYMAYEVNDFTSNDSFSIASASSLSGPWTWLTDVVVISPSTCVSGGCYVWNPHWFIDDDLSVHIYFRFGVPPSANEGNQPGIVDALNSTFTSWSSATTLTGTGWPPATNGDFFMISPGKSPLNAYSLWYKNETDGYIELATSASRTSGYVPIQTGNWLGIGSTWQGITPIHKPDSSWNIYFYTIESIGPGWEYVPMNSAWAVWGSTPIPTTLETSNLTSTGPLQNAP